VKKLNRNKLIQDFEYIREGFNTAYHFIAKTKCAKTTMAAYHKFANILVEQLGGEKVTDLKETNTEQLKPATAEFVTALFTIKDIHDKSRVVVVQPDEVDYYAEIVGNDRVRTCGDTIFEAAQNAANALHAYQISLTKETCCDGRTFVSDIDKRTYCATCQKVLG